MVVIHQVRAARLFFVIVDINFHPAALLGQRGTAISRLEFHTVITWRIMRGGDHHPACGFVIFHSIRNGRGGRISMGQ